MPPKRTPAKAANAAKPSKASKPAKVDKPATRSKAKSPTTDDRQGELDLELGDRVSTLESSMKKVVSNSDKMIELFNKMFPDSPPQKQPDIQIQESSPRLATVRTPRRASPRYTPYGVPDRTVPVTQQHAIQAAPGSALQAQAQASAQAFLPHTTAVQRDYPSNDMHHLLLHGQQHAAEMQLPMSGAAATDLNINNQMANLLSTAQQLSAIKGRPTHPHDFIRRGPTQVKTALDSLDVPEYLYGLLMLARHHTTTEADRPRIAAHLIHVIEDAKDFLWKQVRGWSEEVLTKIAANAFDWSAQGKIDSLRSEGSHYKGGSLHAPPSNLNSHTERYITRPNDRHTNAPTNTMNRGSKRPFVRPPLNRADEACTTWNDSGCNKPDGHIEKGTAQGHHCKYCRKHYNSINFHTEPACRNKTVGPSQPSTHFFRQ